MDFRINEQKEKLNKESLKWINDLKTSFTANRSVGLNFLRHIGGFMKEEGIIEKNEALQKRIIDAANHFEPKFSAMQQSLQNHPVITEHRETATIINEYLNQLLLTVDLQNYYLQYCKQHFSVTSFLQHKLKYSLPRIKISVYAAGKKQNFSDVPNLELYNSLRAWRDKVVEESQKPIYMVANQNALKEIATYLPFSKKDLMKLSGFGRAKAEKYGDEILDLVLDYCDRNNIESNMLSKEENPKRERKEKSTEEKIAPNVISFNLFKEGKTIEEIARERNFAASTIEGHLVPFVVSKEIDINKIVSLEKQMLIREAAKIHGRESFKTLKENLPEDVSYGEIRMVMAAEKGSDESSSYFDF